MIRVEKANRDNLPKSAHGHLETNDAGIVLELKGGPVVIFEDLCGLIAALRHNPFYSEMLDAALEAADDGAISVGKTVNLRKVVDA